MFYKSYTYKRPISIKYTVLMGGGGGGGGGGVLVALPCAYMSLTYLRIDNRRQSVFCATLHYSLVLSSRVSYYISK